MKQRLSAEYLPLITWFFLLADILLLGWWNWLLPAATLALLILLAGAGLLVLWALRRHGVGLLATPLDGGLLLILAAVLVTSALALDPSRSWRLVGQWLLALLAFYGALAAARAGWPARVFGKALLLTLALALLAAYYQLYGWLARWYAAGPWPDLLPPSLPRVWGITNSPNVLAVMLNMAFFFAVAQWPRRGRPPLPALLWLLAALPMLLLPSSRSGWLGFAAAALVYWSSGRWGRIERLDWRALLKAGAALLLFGTAFWLLTNWLRPSTLQGAGDQLDVIFRTRFWGIALDAWLASPFWGHGLNSYATFYLQTTPVPYETLFVAAHNIFFQTLADMGLLGLAAVLTLTAQLLRQVWRRRRQPPTVWQRALLASLAAFAVHSLFDTPETWIMFLAAVQLGLLLGTWQPPPAGGDRAAWRWLWPALGGILLLTGLLGWRADQAYFAGQQAAAAGDWAAAADAFATAQARLPYTDSAVALAQAQAAARLPGGQAAARAAYEVLREQEPGWSLNHANRAGLLWAAGETEAALRQMATAIELAPEVPLYLLNLGLWYEALDRPEEATAVYRRLAALPNVWRESVFWQQTGARRAALDNGVTAAPIPPPRSVSTLIDLLADDPYRPELQFELGLAQLHAGDSSAAAAAWQRAALLSSISSDIGLIRGRARFVALWRLALPGTAAEDVVATLDGLRQQSVYGPGGSGAGNYAMTVFVRLPLAVDLTPGLRCFPVTDALAVELKALADRLAMTGQRDAADQIAALMAGDGDGTAACAGTIP